MLLFVAESKQDYLLWEQAINSYVMQTRGVHEFYNFKEKLGQGSYGHVYLATVKQPNMLNIQESDKEDSGNHASAKPEQEEEKKAAVVQMAENNSDDFSSD